MGSVGTVTGHPVKGAPHFPLNASHEARYPICMSIGPKCLALTLLALILTAASSRAEVPTPDIEAVGSPAGVWIQPTIDLSRVDYVVEEYFISGTASAFSNVGPLGPDGMWTVTPAASAPYKTRILVYRPEEVKK